MFQLFPLPHCRAHHVHTMQVNLGQPPTASAEMATRGPLPWFNKVSIGTVSFHSLYVLCVHWMMLHAMINKWDFSLPLSLLFKVTPERTNLSNAKLHKKEVPHTHWDVQLVANSVMWAK